MPEPVLGIYGGDGLHRLLDCRIEGLAGACFGGSQGRFELAHTQLHRREIRRVGGQKYPPHPAARQGLLNARRFVGRQVVQHHDITWDQRRPQHLRDIRAKDLGIGGPVDRHHRLEAIDPEGSQQRDILAVVVGDAPDGPLPFRSPAIEASHREIDPGFIHKFQALEREPGGPLTVGGTSLLDPRCIAFGGMKGLFFRGSPRRWRTRHIVATLSRSPRRCRSWVQSSARVASGCSWTNWRTKSRVAGSQRG